MIGWQLLLSLLPERHGFAIPNQKPVFRAWVRDDDVPPPTEEYWRFTRHVLDRCLERVRLNPELWADLITRVPDLPSEWRDELLGALESLPGNAMDSAALGSLAAEANKLWRHHTEYADADWSLPRAEVDRLKRLAAGLAPAQEPLERHRWLFEEGLPDLGIPKADQYQEYVNALSGLQRDAAADLWRSGGAEAILQAALSYGYPSNLGAGLAHSTIVDNPVDVVRFLGSDAAGARALASGFLSVLSARDVDKLQPLVRAFEGDPAIQGRILLVADDLADTWPILESLPPGVADVYWREFSTWGHGQEFELVNETARRLAAHGRPAAALEMLSHYVRGKSPVDALLIESLLVQLVREGDEESTRLSPYEIGELIGYLRESSALDEDSMVQLEWRFLPALRLGRDDSALYRALSTSPRFFVQVISILYKPDKSEQGQEQAVDSKVAGNAWRLLREWKRVPGYSDEEQRVVLEDLVAWATEARALLEPSGRLDVGDLQLGQVLAHAPSAEDGTWPAVEVRDFLESYASPHVLRGFHVGVYNKRGVTSRGVTEGGEQEYALARQFEEWARACRAEWPVTAGVLRELADSYVAEGRRFDEDAQRVREGFGF